MNINQKLNKQEVRNLMNLEKTKLIFENNDIFNSPIRQTRGSNRIEYISVYFDLVCPPLIIDKNKKTLLILEDDKYLRQEIKDEISIRYQNYNIKYLTDKEQRQRKIKTFILFIISISLIIINSMGLFIERV